MDDGVQRGSGRHKFEHQKGAHTSWDIVVHQLHSKEQNGPSLNKKILNIIAERDAAIEERNRALIEKKKALEEREAALSERNIAIKERNNAIMERDNALSALQSAMSHPWGLAIQRGTKRIHQQSVNHASMVNAAYDEREMEVVDAQVKQEKEDQTAVSVAWKPQKGKLAGSGMNQKAASAGLKSKNDWVGQELGLNQVQFDDSVMPVPGCSCTGVFRHCYKWGSGGWQSSCCTTTMSQYPLPQMPNKRYARVGGRKMSGSVFTRLLSRLASEGYDFSLPVDLKNHWSKHGTNRYITIK